MSEKMPPMRTPRPDGSGNDDQVRERVTSEGLASKAGTQVRCPKNHLLAVIPGPPANRLGIWRASLSPNARPFRLDLPQDDPPTVWCRCSTRWTLDARLLQEVARDGRTVVPVGRVAVT